MFGNNDACARFEEIDRRAFVLYVVNIHGDYNGHKVYRCSMTANKVRKNLQAHCKQNVYVSKIVGFHEKGCMVCTNGYTYLINDIDDNEGKGIDAFIAQHE